MRKCCSQPSRMLTCCQLLTDILSCPIYWSHQCMSPKSQMGATQATWPPATFRGYLSFYPAVSILWMLKHLTGFHWNFQLWCFNHTWSGLKLKMQHCQVNYHFFLRELSSSLLSFVANCSNALLRKTHSFVVRAAKWHSCCSCSWCRHARENGKHWSDPPSSCECRF